jgi:hypothetical protein
MVSNAFVIRIGVSLFGVDAAALLCADLEERALDNTLTAYELRLNGMTGPLLASGEFISETLNTMAVRYDPATGMVGASVSGMELGSYPANLAATPKFVGFEGVGILDNVVVRAPH